MIRLPLEQQGGKRHEYWGTCEVKGVLWHSTGAALAGSQAQPTTCLSSDPHYTVATCTAPDGVAPKPGAQNICLQSCVIVLQGIVKPGS